MLSIEQIAFAMPSISKAADSAKNMGKVLFPTSSDSDNDRSAQLIHDDNLVDNGDGTFTFTSKVSAEYSYSDTSKSRLQTADGYFELTKTGTYLIELWGGDGGDGGRALLSGRNGLGGKGGFVYGTLEVTETNGLKNKRLYYEIGSKGESKTYDMTGGGNAGEGGGAGEIALVSVGAGGGYSAVYLLDQDETIGNDPTEASYPIDPSITKRDDNKKVLMIAGGGGGGAAGANGFHLTALILKMHGDGGRGGSKESAIQATPDIEGFTSGMYYAGANGTSSGGKTSYVGQGGTDRPEGLARTTIGFMTASTYANDWQRTYHPELRRGVGGAGNLHGGGGGAGFAGGGGGIQNVIVDANNVGGGGGGSSYTAASYDPLSGIGIEGFTAFPLGIESNPYFIDESGNDENADTGGAIVIRYLEQPNYYDYLNKVTISGEISEYFDIESATCVNNVNGTNITLTTEATAAGYQFTRSGRTITMTGSLAPETDGITKGQAKDTLTLTLRLKPVDGFMGGNDVPIFATASGDAAGTAGVFHCGSLVDGQTGKTCKYSYSANDNNADNIKTFSVSHVNVPFKYEVPITKIDKNAGEPYTTNDLIDSTKQAANTTAYNTAINTGFASAAPSASVTDFAAKYSVAKGIHKFTVQLTITPASGGTNAVGKVNSGVITGKSVANVMDADALHIDGFDVKPTKKLTHDGTNYNLDVELDVSLQDNYAEKIEAYPPVTTSTLDITRPNGTATYTTTVTLPAGIYYIEAWGGDGGNGGNKNAGSGLGADTKTGKGGYGGKGGFINGYIKVNENETKTLSISLGAKGPNGTNAGDIDNVTNGQGGHETSVTIVGESSPALIAGGGGGGSKPLRSENYVIIYGYTDGNYHMGYMGINGEGVTYERIPNSTDNTKPYKDMELPSNYNITSTNPHKGEDGKSYTDNEFEAVFGKNFEWIADNCFAKGGTSEKTSSISDSLSGLSISNSNEIIDINSTEPTKVQRGATDSITYVGDLNHNRLGEITSAKAFYVNYPGYFTGSEGNYSSSAWKELPFTLKAVYNNTTKSADEITNQNGKGTVRITRLGVKGDINGVKYDSVSAYDTALNTAKSTALDNAAANISTKAFSITEKFSQYFDYVGYADLADKCNTVVTGTTNQNQREFILTVNTSVAKEKVTSYTSTETSTQPISGYGYYVDKTSYTYSLQNVKMGARVKLKQKDELVGGNDIPLLNVSKISEIADMSTYMRATKDTEVSISHKDTKSAVLDTGYVPRNDGTDWANVVINGDAFNVAVPQQYKPIIINCGEATALDSTIVNASVQATTTKQWIMDFVTKSAAVSPSVITQGGTYTVVGTLSSPDAQKAVVIPPVSPVNKSDQVEVKMRYKVTKALINITPSKASCLNNGEAADITGDNVELAVEGSADPDRFILDEIHDAYVLKLSPQGVYDLPSENSVKVEYDTEEQGVKKAVETADVTKANGVITITIPKSAFTDNITITAAGIENTARHKVYFVYNVYDDVTKSFTPYQDTFKDSNGNDIELAKGVVIEDTAGFAYPYNPGQADLPDGYESFGWDSTADKAPSDNTKHVMGDQDVYFVGSFKATTYTLIINYVSDDSGFIAPPRYTSPEQSNYNKATDTYDIALTKGATFMVKSPEVTGYVPEKLYYSGTVDDDFIAAHFQNGNKVLTVDIEYTLDQTTGANIYHIKCDDNGIPIEEFPRGTTVDPSAYDIFKTTKWDDTTQKEVSYTTFTGSETEGTYYVYYKPHRNQITVNFHEVDTDYREPQPDQSKVQLSKNSMIVYEGLEFSYFKPDPDPEKEEYVVLPTAKCANWQFDGWYTKNGQLIKEDTIVSSSYIISGTTIELYARWKPDEVTIFVDYRYAYNATPDPGELIDVNKITNGEKANQVSVKKKYYMTYSISSPTVTDYTLVDNEQSVITGEALQNEHFDVYYKNSSGEPPAAITLTVNVYSSTNENTENPGQPKSGAHKLSGGKFALFNGDTKVAGSDQENTNGTLVWDNARYAIASGTTYTVQCITPPAGYGTASVEISSSEDEKNVFLDKSPFQLPMAGSKPMTGYTVFGISAMLLAGLLMFAYVNSRTEENNEKE